jgi:ribosomal protein L11 methyltransferase
MKNKSWLEVSLVVDGELAEAVADLLRRYIPDGVVIESTAVTAGPADENGHAVGPLKVFGYIPQDNQLEETRQKIEQGLWYLGRISPLPLPEYKQIEDINWMEAWKDHYHPIPIGNRLLIVPAWLNPSKSGRIPIRIELGMAFGTGTHPTTQLCLGVIEKYIDLQTSPSGTAVIDIGCGSGILSIAALKLGAEKALGVDIDGEAIKAATANATLNQVNQRLELSIGSVTEIVSGKFSLRQAHLVLANILAPVLVQLLDQGLDGLLIPEGWLVLSGILLDQSQTVEIALSNHGLRLIEKQQIGDWTALAATK